MKRILLAIAAMLVTLGIGTAPLAHVSAAGWHRAYQVCSSEHGTSGQFGQWITAGVSTTPLCSFTVTYRNVLGPVDGSCTMIPWGQRTAAVC